MTYWLTITKYSFLKWQWIFFLLHRLTRLLHRLLPYFTMSTTDVVYETGTAYPSRTFGFTSVFWLSRFSYHFNFMCYVFLFCVSSFCVLWPILSVSLDCRLLNGSSVYYNVYFHWEIIVSLEFICKFLWIRIMTQPQKVHS